MFSGFNKGNIEASNFNLGGQTPNTTVVAQTIEAILYANSFQLLLSIAYFQYNGLITSMLLSREFTNFARER